MPHFRDRIKDVRNKIVTMRFTESELLALDSLLDSRESRTEFIVGAINAYMLKREKRNSRKP